MSTKTPPNRTVLRVQYTVDSDEPRLTKLGELRRCAERETGEAWLWEIVDMCANLATEYAVWPDVLGAARHYFSVFYNIPEEEIEFITTDEEAHRRLTETIHAYAQPKTEDPEPMKFSVVGEDAAGLRVLLGEIRTHSPGSRRGTGWYLSDYSTPERDEHGYHPKYFNSTQDRDLIEDLAAAFYLGRGYQFVEFTTQQSGFRRIDTPEDKIDTPEDKIDTPEEKKDPNVFRIPEEDVNDAAEALDGMEILEMARWVKAYQTELNRILGD